MRAVAYPLNKSIRITVSLHHSNFSKTLLRRFTRVRQTVLRTPPYYTALKGYGLNQSPAGPGQRSVVQDRRTPRRRGVKCRTCITRGAQRRYSQSDLVSDCWPVSAIQWQESLGRLYKIHLNTKLRPLLHSKSCAMHQITDCRSRLD